MSRIRESPLTYRLQGVFTAIADPNRRRMLDDLAASEMTAGEIAARYAMSRPAVATHLKVLRDCGLVEVTPRGRERVHRLNPEPLTEVRIWLGRYERFWDDRLETLKALAEAAARQDGGSD